MKIDFGKYRGEEMEDLPSNYLRWIAENITDDVIVVNEAEAILAQREGHGRVVRDRNDA